MKFIANSTHYLSTFFAFLAITLSTSTSAQFINKKWHQEVLIAPSGSEIQISWAATEEEKTKGLSGLKAREMPKNAGLLFVYVRVQPLRFWMPETLFDLDIIFLDENFKVVALETLPHYPTRLHKELIPTTNTYKGQFVLELHAGTAKKLKITKGSQLKWKKPLSPQFLHSLGIK